ncbi:Nucleoporin-like protein 2 [Eufriesea mexicana]|nr:Nucleoporin-like protein 2 [Eufriesea mexicana]
MLVANEIINAERGGQWMLSCFAPFIERPCIPGMEDVSPEEVRWEMYQAQKNGMVEQAKLHFQQMCRDMKTKWDAFKNPTRETLNKLKEILGTGHKDTRNDNTSGKSSNFTFATPQLGLPSSTSSNVFGNKTFGNQSNPFTGGFTSTTNTSIFGRTATTSNPVFGQNTQTFGSSGSIFGGGSSQPVFGQPSIFGTINQVNNVFGRHQTSQAPTSTTNSIFGTTPSSETFSSGIFSQSETPAFGGAPVFGGSATFGNSSSSIFGEKPTFGTSGNIFATSNNTTPAFSSTQSTNAFGVSTSTPSVNIFGNAQSTTPIMSTSSASPFVAISSATTSPFATATSQFETTSTASFSKPTFGTATGTAAETTATSSSTSFGTANTGPTFGTTSSSTSPFATSTFGDVKNSPFGSTNVTTTTTKPQQITSPFGTFAQSSTSNTVTGSTNGPFGKPFGVTLSATIIDDSHYSIDNQLTDDEKSMYMAEKFTFGKIPLKPPTKDIR